MPSNSESGQVVALLASARLLFESASMTARNRRVVHSFLDQQPLDGTTLSTDGRKLVKHGMGGEVVAKWVGRRILITSSMATRTDQSVVRMIRRAVKDRVYEKAALSFEHGCDMSGDQFDCWLLAMDGRTVAGRVSYSKWRGEVSIQIIRVARGYQRQGVASAMIRDLLRRERMRYSDLDWGMLTPAGARLKDVLDRQLAFA